MISKLKSQLEQGVYANLAFPYQKTYPKIKNYVNTLQGWNEIVSAILQCVNIRTINYHPQDPYEIKEYYAKTSKERHPALPSLSWDEDDTENYARKLLYRDAFEYVLTKKINERYSASDYRPPVCSTLHDYLYATSRLVLDANVIENVVEREMQLNEKDHA